MSAGVAAGSREARRARIVASALDHLVGSILTNADSEHAAKLFLNACEQDGTLTMQDAGLENGFLDRLLPALACIDRLPPHLVPFMIRRFSWPETLAEAKTSEALRSDVGDLLLRHADESWISSDEAPLVTDTAELMIDDSERSKALFGVLLGAVSLLAIALYLWARAGPI